MKERPEKWEVVCKQCLSGLIMSDEEVSRRLNGDARTWPNHCGKSMSLRDVFVPRDKNIKCSHFGCHYAQNARCSCHCEGKYHGMNLEYREYDKPMISEKPWYKIPIRQFIS